MDESALCRMRSGQFVSLCLRRGHGVKVWLCQLDRFLRCIAHLTASAVDSSGVLYYPKAICVFAKLSIVLLV